MNNPLRFPYRNPYRFRVSATFGFLLPTSLVMMEALQSILTTKPGSRLREWTLDASGDDVWALRWSAGFTSPERRDEALARATRELGTPHCLNLWDEEAEV